jgi:hypothetical protein
MILAIQAYNNPKSHFRSEVFIVTAVIAWTYLMHAYYRTKGVDYRYYQSKDGQNSAARTKHGAYRHWDLETCLNHQASPVDKHTTNNPLFLISIRHEIEHQMTSRIDDALSAKLQACALNFNRHIRLLFGDHVRLDRDFDAVIHLAGFTLDQQRALFRERGLPSNVVAAQNDFESRLSEDDYNDERYAFRVALVQKAVSNRGTADQVVEFIKSGSEQGEAINRYLLKMVEYPKFKPTKVVRIVQQAGYPKFTLHQHTLVCRKLDARDPKKNYGIMLSDGNWYWYESWVERVKQHCAENAATYR